MLLSTETFGEDWPHFRGPNSAGIATESRPLPAEFSAEKNVRWSKNSEMGLVVRLLQRVVSSRRRWLMTKRLACTALMPLPGHSSGCESGRSATSLRFIKQTVMLRQHRRLMRNRFISTSRLLVWLPLMRRREQTCGTRVCRCRILFLSGGRHVAGALQGFGAVCAG